MGWFLEIRNGVSRIYTPAEQYFARDIDTLNARFDARFQMIGSLSE